jgi:hypothetical protein
MLRKPPEGVRHIGMLQVLPYGSTMQASNMSCAREYACSPVEGTQPSILDYPMQKLRISFPPGPNNPVTHLPGPDEEEPILVLVSSLSKG